MEISKKRNITLLHQIKGQSLVSGNSISQACDNDYCANKSITAIFLNNIMTD